MLPDEGPVPGGYRQIVFWEFVQNLPMVAGFFLGLAAWQVGKIWTALAWMAVGSALGAFAIWATESRIEDAHRESIQVVLANCVTFLTLMALVAAYLATSWSHYGTDLLFGLVAGVALGIVQDIARRAPIDATHCAAMAAAISLAIVGIRLLAATVPLGGSVLIITSLATVVIVRMDYAASRVDSTQDARRAAGLGLPGSKLGLEFVADGNLELERKRDHPL